MKQIFLFTGENTFAMREERRRWMEEFRRRHSSENLVVLEGRDVVLRELLDEIATCPFLSERRLVFVDGATKLLREHAALITTTIHPQTVLVFLEGGAGRRSLGKGLLEVCEVKEFPLLRGRALRVWLLQRAVEQGVELTPASADLLLEWCSEEQGMLDQELQKLSLALKGRAVTSADVERLSVPSGEGVVWRLTDLLCAGRKEEALVFARRFLERGGDPFGLWVVLLRMLQHLVLVAVAIAEGKRSAQAVSGQCKLHLLAVRSLLPFARRVAPDDLRSFLDAAVDADVGLKTGSYRATEEAPEELLALIDTFILTCP